MEFHTFLILFAIDNNVIDVNFYMLLAWGGHYFKK
jgi:hypothetical protein